VAKLLIGVKVVVQGLGMQRRWRPSMARRRGRGVSRPRRDAVSSIGAVQGGVQVTGVACCCPRSAWWRGRGPGRGRRGG